MIHKKAVEDREYQKPEYFLPSGRAALCLALKQVKGKILLPSYIGLSPKEGSGVFDPVREAGTPYEFYALGKDLSIIRKELEQKLKPQQVGALLVIHYFGFRQNDMQYIKGLCAKRGVLLIEDCAHAFASYHRGKKLGTIGDMSIYSIHKFLPTKDGGILRINNPAISPAVSESISEHALKVLCKADIPKISKARRANYNYLLKKIRQVVGTRPFMPKLPAGIVPLNFPIIIERKDRNTVYFELLKRGIETVSLYHTLIPEIGKEYASSHLLSSKILNLPIHEGISSPDIDFMVKELSKVLA